MPLVCSVLGVPLACSVLGVPLACSVLGVPFVCGVLVVCLAARFAGSGVGGGASRFTRDDFRLPFSKMVVGPSALNDFQGGDAARDAERGVEALDSSTFRRFAARCCMTPPSSVPSSGAATPSSLMGTLTSCPVLSPSGVALCLVVALRASLAASSRSSRSAGVPRSIQRGRLPRKASQQGDHPAHSQIMQYRPDETVLDICWLA